MSWKRIHATMVKTGIPKEQIMAMPHARAVSFASLPVVKPEFWGVVTAAKGSARAFLIRGMSRTSLGRSGSWKATGLRPSTSIGSAIENTSVRRLQTICGVPCRQSRASGDHDRVAPHRVQVASSRSEGGRSPGAPCLSAASNAVGVLSRGTSSDSAGGSGPSRPAATVVEAGFSRNDGPVVERPRIRARAARSGRCPD